MGKKKRHVNRKPSHRGVGPCKGSHRIKSDSIEYSGIRGLINIGNTCFLNSTIQALYASIGEIMHMSDVPNAHIYTSFIDTFKSLYKSNPKSVNPSYLLSMISIQSKRFKNKQQHDAHELLVCLLSSMLDELQQQEEEDCKGILKQFFNGLLGSVIVCCCCGKRSCSLNDFIDLSLEIPGSSHLNHPKGYRYKPPPKKTSVTDDLAKLTIEQSTENDIKTDTNECCSEFAAGDSSGVNIDTTDSNDTLNVQTESAEEVGEQIDIVEPECDLCDSINIHTPSLYGCLYNFFSRELLHADGGNGYRCTACARTGSSGQLQDATKRLLVVDSPELLVLHLKRLLPGGKCTTHISFPLELDMTPFTGRRKTNSSADLQESNRTTGELCGQESPAEGSVPDNLENESDEKSHIGDRSIYSLRAVIVHQGGALGGHYTAYVLHGDDWHYTSDTVTRKANLKDVLACEAYMLMYRRKQSQSTSEIELSESGVVEDN
mmetsp:Transcript_15354/g.23114  ORF Transcript_15354/g.23114 Transcript_15354/m.23114 type:complete len:489 (-) Transcript_15354:136-1602(-)